MAGALNNVSSYGSDKRDDMDLFREPSTSKKCFLGDRDDSDDLLDSEVMERSTSSKRNSKVVSANSGAL